MARRGHSIAARRRSRGTALAAAALVLLATLGAFVAIELARVAGGAREDRITDRALAEAREALIAYAADRPVSTSVGPGYLPCPDSDNDGWAESTCGSLAGDVGQGERLGRLPWKTLGIADLRDGHGERLWYAVSTRYKGLLNCAASRACVDMSPDAALGTITVRDNSGIAIHDGTAAEAYRAAEGGAVAVLIAPGAPLARADAQGGGIEQSRACAAGDCDASGRCTAEPPTRAATCDARNYLDRAPAARFAFEDNADFHDRSDAGRRSNGNGFIQGPVVLGDGRLAVNDRVAAIGYRDVMPRIMRRVALEALHCLREHAASEGRFPWPAPPCAQAGDAAAAWQARPGVHFGRIAEQAFGGMCAIDPAVSPSWWTAWRPYVFYALARGAARLELAEPSGRIVARDKDVAVIVAGPPLARNGFVQDRSAAALARVGEWLEEGNARLEGAAGCPASPPNFPCEVTGTCTRITTAAGSRAFNDVAIAAP